MNRLLRIGKGDFFFIQRGKIALGFGNSGIKRQLAVVSAFLLSCTEHGSVMGDDFGKGFLDGTQYGLVGQIAHQEIEARAATHGPEIKDASANGRISDIGGEHVL